MATREGTRIGGTLTLLLAFVITIVVIVVIFAYFDGVFKFVSGGTATMAVSGAFALSGNQGNTGNVVMVIRDTSQASIVGVSLSCPSSQFASAGCGKLVLTQNGSPVSSVHPLTTGQTGTGSATLESAPGTSFSQGTVYTITVIATFSDGTTLSQALVLPAQ
ncbi:MAG: hypothetical protein OK474_06130 [Thaumarchaeota archaeon]|nr:hypothetical protein [Nitrososphaerota archaeon]